jgi:TonB family protein
MLKARPLPRAVARKIEPPKPLAPPVVPVLPVDAPGIEEPEIHAKLPVPNVSKQLQSMAAVAPPSPPPSRPRPTVHPGLFGQVEGHSVSERIPLKQVQTGGFGDPEGLPGRAQAGNPGNVPKLGAFDLAAGPGRGNGIGGLQGSPRTVANTGFGGGGVGIGVSRGPGGGAPAAVKTGVFGAAPESTQAPVKSLRAAPPAPETQPVEVLFKPSPQYTEEARRLRVEGEVVLSVVFQADGTLRVVGVVKSLGHGLDQMAEQAASQIRFKPAEQAGKPADFPATLRIAFRLA